MKHLPLFDKLPKFYKSLELLKKHFFTVPFLVVFNTLTVHAFLNIKVQVFQNFSSAELQGQVLDRD